MPTKIRQKFTSPKVSRPKMTKGYGVDPKQTAGMLKWEDVRKQLTEARNYWLATTRPDGRAHAMPIWGLWFDDAFCFGTDPKSVKGQNLKKNPNAVVHLESGDDVVIIEGLVDRVKNGPAVKQYAAAYYSKYKFKPGNSFHRLKPSVVLAWREKDFPSSATRWKL